MSARNATAADLPAVPGPAPAQSVLQVAPEGVTATICVDLPLRIVSEANAREHWQPKARRAREHRAAARALLQRYARPVHGGQITIGLVRIAPRKLDDDNLAGGFKAVRDGVADWLGIDDGSDRLRWTYGQRKGRAKEYAAQVVVMWSPE